MTNKSLSSANKPFLLKPIGKDYLWGGERLKTDYGKNLPLTPLAETWECSTHPDGSSIVDSGEYKGLPLGEVLNMHPEYLGSHPSSLLEEIRQKSIFAQQDDKNRPSHDTAYLQLPILIKLIDAKHDLSVQVHPDDDYAQSHENGSLGKTELWYILDAAPNSKLVYGFNRDMTPALLRQSLKQGTIEKYLQKVPIQKDDVLYMEAGTVHAIGAGVLTVEIQENSNLTYRLYDYARTDKNGNLRELHIEKALDVINYKSSCQPRQPIRVLRYHPGCASELLCRCKYFQVERLLINTALCPAALPDCSTAGNSFHVLLCTEGEGCLIDEEQKQLPFSKGSCIFLPADSISLRLQGKAQLLRVSC